MPIWAFGQDKNGCPSKSERGYKCGNVKEDILSGLAGIEYSFDANVTVTLDDTKLRKSKDRVKAQKVLKLVNQVLNDADFWKALEHYNRYQFAKWSKKFNDTWTVLEKDKITNAFIHGDPNNSERPSQISIEAKIRLYGSSFQWPGEIARAKEIGDGYIYNKKWFFRDYSIVEIGSNWVHELSHSKGFRHCRKCHKERDYSVPYVINRIFKEVAKKYVTE